jgi:EpsI family protein
VRLDRRLLGFLCVGLVALAMGPIARTSVVRIPALIVRAPLPPMPDCVSLHGWAANWAPTFIASDHSTSDTYQCDGYRIHVMVVQYIEQHQGKEAVAEFNSVIPRSWWNATTRDRRAVGDALEVDEYSVDRAPLRLTIWNWYAVGVHPASSELVVKAFEGANALLLRSSATSNFTVAIEAESGLAAARVLEVDALVVWEWFTNQVEING